MANDSNTGLIVVASILGVTLVGGVVYLLTRKNTATAPVNPYAAGYYPSNPSYSQQAASAANKAATLQAGSSALDSILGLFKKSDSSGLSDGGVYAQGGWQQQDIISVLPDKSLFQTPAIVDKTLPTEMPAWYQKERAGFTGAGMNFAGFNGAGKIFQ